MRFKRTENSFKNYARDCAILALILFVFFFTLLGTRPLFIPDEGRYAEIAREMFVRGDWITPYLNGIEYFEKPPLFYWLGAAHFFIFGVNLWSIRSINALFAILCCLATYITSRRLYGRDTAWLASGILATSLLFFVMAHMVTLDMPLCTLLSITLYSLILSSRQNPSSPQHQGLCLIAALSAGLAVLTKGLVGLVLPFGITGLWILITHEWRFLRHFKWLSAFLLFLAITLPWHLSASLIHPEFAYFYFIEQQFLRYTQEGIGHTQAFWFFIPVCIVGFLPWIFFLPQAIAFHLPPTWKMRRAYQTQLFFLIWIAVVFIFFSLSASKLIPYVLPLFPPMAIIVARYIMRALILKKHRGLLWGLSVLSILTILIVIASIIFLNHVKVNNLPHARFFLYTSCGFLLSGSLLFIVCIRKEKNKLGLALLIGFLALALIDGMAAIPPIDTRSTWSLVKKLKPLLHPQDEVMTFNNYYQDLPFYLQRRITIVNWKNELEFGMRYQNTQDWMIHNLEFWKRWQSSKRVFVILGKSELANLSMAHPEIPIYILFSSVNYVLISNQAES